MTGPQVTAAMVENYWRWAIGLTCPQITSNNVITTDPGDSRVAFLMDPRDVGGVVGCQGNPNQTTAGLLGAPPKAQSVLIPLWIACADDTDGVNNAILLPKIAQINSLLGNIISHVKINGADVLSTPFLNVDVCEITPLPNPTVSFTYNAPTLQPGTSLYQVTSTANSLNFFMHSTSCKFKNQVAPKDNWVADVPPHTGNHPYAAHSGLWAMISRADAGDGITTWQAGTDFITYDTTVTQDACNGPLSSSELRALTTITYNVT